MGKLLLGQTVQGVSLILLPALCPAKGIPSIIQLTDLCVMPGGDIIRPDGPAPVKERFPRCV